MCCPRLIASLALACLALAGSAVPSASAATPPTRWLCKPGLKRNPCTPRLKTTVFSPSGKRLRTTNPARHEKVDCFYVYPTVSDQQRANATLQIDPEERSIALYQAARFSQECRVFAPMYRQRTIAYLAGRFQDSNPSIVSPEGYADVLKAWRTYLKRYNHGRGVVLIGHSQGTFTLRRLIAAEVDRSPSARRRLMSAILPGGDVTVGKGGDFKNIPACRSKRQIGCVMAWSTYVAPAPANTLFGQSPAPGARILCTNPAALGGGSGIADPVLPSEPFAPGTTIAAGIALLGLKYPATSAPWISAPSSYSARCTTGSGPHVLEIKARRGAQTPKPSPDATWGEHLMDVNVALGNLTGVVNSQAAAWRRAH
jgi:hypothetical protein